MNINYFIKICVQRKELFNLKKSLGSQFSKNSRDTH